MELEFNKIDPKFGDLVIISTKTLSLKGDTFPPKEV